MVGWESGVTIDAPGVNHRQNRLFSDKAPGLASCRTSGVQVFHFVTFAFFCCEIPNRNRAGETNGVSVEFGMPTISYTIRRVSPHPASGHLLPSDGRRRISLGSIPGVALSASLTPG